ncbi:MAG: cytochrome P450 [Granulosicoccus sp.]
MSDNTLYRPPAPTPSSPLRSLLRVIRQGDGDLLSLVPEEAYRKQLTWLGYSRRSILLINDTELCRQVLHDKDGIFPKNDLMVGALEGLVGNSLFVSSGASWRRQRQMIDPAFSQLRINSAFASMNQAVQDYQSVLDTYVEQGETFSLDKAMSHLTADIICRTIFSQPLSSDIAGDVFNDFLLFERSVASVDLKQLIFGKPWAKISQPAPVVEACQRIRRHIGTMLDPRIHATAENQSDDIVSAIISARDSDTGDTFTREELIDQIGVFFLAGHETTASVLTWVFFILSQQPAIAKRIADDVQRATGGGEIQMEHLRQLPYLRNVFREALRLYPPITFLPRVALQPTIIADKRVKRGTMIMISPWTAHRNAQLWENADRFDPDRFTTQDDEEHPLRKKDKGTHLSFGIGPRVCIGASFATMEATLIIARLARRYQFSSMNADTVRPVARLTTRPAVEIQVQLRHRQTA